MPAARARPSSSPLSSWPCPCRTSTWSSFRFSIDARQQRVAQGVAAVLVQCGVVGFADAEHVLGALAEGGDARVVHAQAALAQHVRDVGQQARAVGTDQAEYGLPAIGAVGELDARDEGEVAEVARR